MVRDGSLDGLSCVVAATFLTSTGATPSIYNRAWSAILLSACNSSHPISFIITHLVFHLQHCYHFLPPFIDSLKALSDRKCVREERISDFSNSTIAADHLLHSFSICLLLSRTASIPSFHVHKGRIPPPFLLRQCGLFSLL